MDLVGHRRRGHNELDSPMITLPLSYNAIEAHPTVLQQYARLLEAQGMTSSSRVQEMRVGLLLHPPPFPFYITDLLHHRIPALLSSGGVDVCHCWGIMEELQMGS